VRYRSKGAATDIAADSGISHAGASIQKAPIAEDPDRRGPIMVAAFASAGNPRPDVRLEVENW
jgi:hypothetical protein